MAWEHQKSGTTIFFDIVRHILILCGTGYILSLIWEHSSVFGLLAVIPVYVIMLNLVGFLTLPLYSFTPENRAKSKMLKAMQNGDLESAKKQTDTFIKEFNVNVPQESETVHDIAKVERNIEAIDATLDVCNGRVATKSVNPSETYQQDMAEKLYKKDPELAIRIAMGEENAPDGIMTEAIYSKVCYEAEKSNNLDLCGQLANSFHNSEISANAQKLNFRTSYSAIEGMKKVVNARRKAIKKTLPKGKTIEPECQQCESEEQMREELDSLKSKLKMLEDPDTLYSFGLMAFDGDGVEKDFVEVANWFRIAAEKGSAKAQHGLALMYESGQGVSQDYTQSMKWYHMAAEQGYAGSQNNLGRLFENGHGVTQDYLEATKWYRKAAENGDMNGLSNRDRLEAKIDLDKYQSIVVEFSNLTVAHRPLIGDCNLLPYPKKTILYAIKWVTNYLETKQEATTDQSLCEKLDDLISTHNYLLTELARDWHEIDIEDKVAIAEISKFDTFPDWALPLKLKYIDEEKASIEAFDAQLEVLKDTVAKNSR